MYCIPIKAQAVVDATAMNVAVVTVVAADVAAAKVQAGVDLAAMGAWELIDPP